MSIHRGGRSLTESSLEAFSCSVDPSAGVLRSGNVAALCSG